MKFLFVFLLLIFASGNALPEEIKKTSEEEFILNPENEPFYNVLVGVSPFFGLMGFEIHKKSHSIGFGFPVRLFYRYYENPYGDSMFYGLYAGYSKQPNNAEKKVNGVEYKDVKTVDAGFGVGYRWQWQSGWNLTTSISIHYMNEEFTNPGLPDKKEISVLPFPGVNVGYKF